jgi:hypothetical protein
MLTAFKYFYMINIECLESHCILTKGAGSDDQERLYRLAASSFCSF